MKTTNFDFVGNFKKVIIIPIAIILIGVIFAFINGVSMDINFKGGSRFTYTYSGDVDVNKVKDVSDKLLNKNTNVSLSSSTTDAGSSKIIVSVADLVTTDDLEKKDAKDTASDKKDGESATVTTVYGQLEQALKKAFPKNDIAFAESNTVEATMATSFFIKSLVAVLIAAIFVIVYVGIRFRKIGGISAAIFAWVALINDILVAFSVMTILNLEIDTNFVAVILTILGYSLNDTIVIYDRVRDNRRRRGGKNIAEVVNLSINQTLSRTIITSVTTFVAIVVVAVVAEFFGLTTLRSFAIPMSIGIIAGTFSSIFIATPLWVKWREYRQKRKELKK